jgi:hypothetical protein
VQANCQCKPTRMRRAGGPLASVGHSSASDSDSERPIPRDGQTKTRFNERHLSSHRRTGKGHSGCQRCSASREARLGGSCVTGPTKSSEAIRPRWMSGPGGLGPWPGLEPGGLVGQLPRTGASNSMKWQCAPTSSSAGLPQELAVLLDGGLLHLALRHLSFR